MTTPEHAAPSPGLVERIKGVAKAITGLFGAGVTAVLASGAIDVVPKWLAIVSAAATGVGVWLTKNP